jgi:hypothetical protein
MKKIILLFILLSAFGHSSFSQCAEPITLPYLTDAESANVPELPDCVYSGYMAFSSSKIFETTGTPVAGFTGNVFVYDTTVSEGITENAWVAVTLGAAEIAFEEDTSYQVSFRYGMENPEGTIGMLRIMLAREGEYIYLHEEENIAAGTVSYFVSAPFMVAEADSYYFIIEIQTEGGQGNLYLDDITIQEAPTASMGKNLLADLGVYPNPVKDFVTITGKSEISRAEVYTIHGQKVFERAENNIQQVNTAGMAKGVYILKLHSANASKSIKLIKE